MADVFKQASFCGRTAVITAGWQEREEEINELADHLNLDVTNLNLYRRAERVFNAEPDFHHAYSERQNMLLRLQRIYRMRLEKLLDVARRFLKRSEDPDLMDLERESAIADVRRLDEHHLSRIREIHASFNQVWKRDKLPGLQAETEAVARDLHDCDALCIAGGHVAILLNRMRMFNIAQAADGLPIVAWSAGAMAISERIVLFHDSPPQGAGNAELLESGLGLHRGLIALPHADQRLRLDDPIRVSLFARRFHTSLCVALDAGAVVHWDGTNWHTALAARALTQDGQTQPLELACP